MHVISVRLKSGVLLIGACRVGYVEKNLWVIDQISIKADENHRKRILMHTTYDFYQI